MIYNTKANRKVLYNIKSICMRQTRINLPLSSSRFMSGTVENIGLYKAKIGRKAQYLLTQRKANCIIIFIQEYSEWRIFLNEIYFKIKREPVFRCSPAYPIFPAHFERRSRNEALFFCADRRFFPASGAGRLRQRSYL